MIQTTIPGAGAGIRRNRVTHVAGLSAAEPADGLLDPKLVLSWLRSTLGAPAAAIGLPMPLREAGALLPQLYPPGPIRAMRAACLARAAGTRRRGWRRARSRWRR